MRMPVWLTALACFASTAAAQSYPAKPLRLIEVVPWGAGSI